MEHQKMINFYDNKIADAVAMSYDGRILQASKNSQQNNSEVVTKRMINKYLKTYIYIYPEERQKNIDNLDIIIIV